MNYNIVTELSRNIRAIALESLRGSWKVAVIATAVYMLALAVPMAILDVLFGGETGSSPLSGLYSMLVTGPFTLGYSLFCLNLFRKKEFEVAQVFSGFEKFGKALGLYIVMCIFIFLWSLLLVIPGIIAAYRYSQSFLIMIDHPEYSINQCISESKRMMTGNKMKYFCLQLSFIGWAILAVIPLMVIVTALAFSGSVILTTIGSIVGMVGYFFLTPYISVAGSAFYELANGNLKPGVIQLDALDATVTEVKDNAEASEEK